MFTNGQLIFGGLFAIVFAIVLFYTYRKDLKLHRKYYKGSLWILLAFIGFIVMISVVKYIIV
ncbi:hypothetical protein ES711_05970 [Gelidibacter salicanalis]|uniref:Uncharacterized protein n=1 Tax=Gelidibacter salicanalis TaxID=291193 RepID=A0A5C7ASL1_9FLAO|nr:hypothetical protein [Gelidibacter salicanalis]TXE09465.1 hypothetical protein ES711_05970 [Gelidibacter salicanalis]